MILGNLDSMGFVSIIPIIIAIALCFTVKDVVISLSVACIIGTLLAGQGVFGFPNLLMSSLGNEDFAWIMLFVSFVSVITTMFRKTGAIQGFTAYVEEKNLSRKQISFTAWLIGCLVFFSDCFSPLFVGTSMRSLTDKAKISREKLAYIADSTAAAVTFLYPISGAVVYASSLLIGYGNIKTKSDAIRLFAKSMPFNFYCILSVLFVLLICLDIIKDFGPMKEAEDRG
jgi:Na+/H+ antiporter NhaC